MTPRHNASTVTVRQAVACDLGALVPLFDTYRQFYGRDSNPGAAREFLSARIERGESVLFIAHEAHVPIGFAQLYPSFSSVSLARTFILNDLFVCEPWRKRRVGSQLIAAAIKFAESAGAVRLTLSTAITNQTAQAVYQAAGWKQDEQFLYYHFAIQA